MFHMQRQHKLPEEHARFYSAEVILALHFLHTRGILNLFDFVCSNFYSMILSKTISNL